MMNNDSHKSRGYKPHVARELLGITKERLRYWKANLDPRPTRTHFTANDLLAYRIIKACVQDLRINPNELKAFDLSSIFNFCQTHTFHNVGDYLIKLNLQTNSLTIHSETESIDFRNRKISYLYLDELVKEHFSAFMALGTEQSLH